MSKILSFKADGLPAGCWHSQPSSSEPKQMCSMVKSCQTIACRSPPDLFGGISWMWMWWVVLIMHKQDDWVTSFQGWRRVSRSRPEFKAETSPVSSISSRTTFCFILLSSPSTLHNRKPRTRRTVQESDEAMRWIRSEFEIDVALSHTITK